MLAKGEEWRAVLIPTLPPTARRKPPTPPSSLVCSQFRPPLLAKAHLDLNGMSPCAQESRLQGSQYPWGRQTRVTQTMPGTTRHGTLGAAEVPLCAARLNPGHCRPRVEPRLATPGPPGRGEDCWKVLASHPSEGRPDGCSDGLGQSWGGSVQLQRGGVGRWVPEILRARHVPSFPFPVPTSPRATR